MDNVTDADLALAETRGHALYRNAPRAIAARYDTETRRIVIELVNGCIYAFPASLAQDLEGADPADLADARVDGLGFNLRFPALDADLFIPALISGIFGTKAWMAARVNQNRAPAAAV